VATELDSAVEMELATAVYSVQERAECLAWAMEPVTVVCTANGIERVNEPDRAVEMLAVEMKHVKVTEMAPETEKDMSQDLAVEKVVDCSWTVEGKAEGWVGVTVLGRALD
jgi:hypothetical protein